MINLLTETQPWEERQIRKRGEALVRSEFSQDAELILNRKLQGAMLGHYTLTPEEQIQVDWFNTMVTQARNEVDKALADNELLQQILAHEAAQRDVAELTLRIEGRAEAWIRTGEEVVPGALVECPGGIGTVSSIRPHDPALGETEDDDLIAIWVEDSPDIHDDYRYEVFAVRHVSAAEPLTPTLDTVDEQGNPLTLVNPAYEQAVAALAAAEAIIAGASADVLNWVEQRA